MTSWTNSMNKVLCSQKSRIFFSNLTRIGVLMLDCNSEKRPDFLYTCSIFSKLQLGNSTMGMILKKLMLFRTYEFMYSQKSRIFLF